jgi:PAS domain S-box-containing protein
MLEIFDNNSLAYSLLEAMPDVVFLVDQEGLIVYVNLQISKVLGYTKDELSGKAIEIFLPDHLKLKHRQYRNDYQKEPRTRPMGGGVELTAKHKNGSVIPVEISLSPIELNGSLFVVAALREISERKRLEQENWKMQESDRLKNILLKNISHELRTPLNAIVGLSQLLLNDVGHISPECHENISIILSSSRQLLQLITEMINFSDIQSQQIELKPEQVNVSDLVKDVIDSLKVLVDKKNTRINVTIDPALSTICIDPVRFKQVIYNYLSNALKFSIDSNVIDIKIHPESDDRFRLEVKDYGLGINDSDLKKIFTGFEKSSSTANQYPGLGLSMVVTKQIVHAQGGTVGVDSVLGKGSTFYAVLPRKAVQY